ncbi:MAG TPA: SURF1 family protein [Oxalicibacterium sp.]|uniref:SURF1 family protein n=1 Tax=Oxalicibacterium sp. TaxID=2766525 RepID=UPI002C3E5D2A|nr:SURF1 family protein [Oxalicibacterium sp.]HWU96916.1 SURF1 family protein [Oxalicibacterium sp.]
MIGREREGGTVSAEADHSRSSAVKVGLAVVALVFFAGFIALGTWQVYRLQWKLALIERVEQRVHAAPVPVPGPDLWPQVTAASDEYRHVRLTGTLLPEFSARVQAVTDLGSGYWLLTPMRMRDGSIVLINRGFILPTTDISAENPSSSSPEVSITGLLRISEPGGGFLRHNDPTAERWYSRDVQAIAAARKLQSVAPYFVDADAGSEVVVPGSTVRPVGGLTVIAFHNSHLVYALTWYALALMVAGAAFWVMRDARRRANGTDRKTEDGSHNRHSSD